MLPTIGSRNPARTSTAAVASEASVIQSRRGGQSGGRRAGERLETICLGMAG
jgi:hypothetical protein